MQTKRIGELLIDLGVMTPEQVQQVLDLQVKWGLPFGAIASRVFGIGDRAIWQARAIQVIPLLPVVDLNKEKRSAAAKDIILRDEAVYYGILPLRTEGGELVCATSRDCLPEAMAFLCSTLRIPACFALAAPGQLQDAILKVYGLGIDELEDKLSEGSPSSPGGPRAEYPDPALWPERVVYDHAEADRPRRLSPVYKESALPWPRIDDPSLFLAPLMAKQKNFDPLSPAALLERPTRVIFACPHCENRINVPSTYADKRVKCPKCAGVVRVPPPRGRSTSAA